MPTNVRPSSSAVRILLGLALSAGAASVSGEALANTVNQNSSWTIKNPEVKVKGKVVAPPTYRVVAYGDSIFAGYYGSISHVAKRASPYVQGEYLFHAWNQSQTVDVEVIRRTKSGAKADDIYNNKIIGERSYMQDASTRVVAFEMCGNDGLQARSAFRDQEGTCDYAPLDSAVASCTTYQEKAMQAINQYAPAGAKKMVMSLYYPGYDADNTLSKCTDASTGQQVNMQELFLPILAKMNWRACNFAEQYGFTCVDAFAQYMAADYDGNGDGLVDSEAITWRSGESEAAYIDRISVALRDTISDSNAHFVSPSASYDYILSDDTHPTYYGSDTIYVGMFGGTGSGSGAPDFSASQVSGGKNPVWNQYGHERAGWAHSIFNPLSP